MKIQELEFPDSCPVNCIYHNSFRDYGQSALCTRCPLFCCKPFDYTNENGDIEKLCLIEPEDFRHDWLVEWHKFFADGTEPVLELRMEKK